MTVFATSVLDNFNRANESPLSGGGNWLPTGFTPGSDPDGGGLTSEVMALSSNRASIGGGGAASSMAWVASGALGDCEAYATLVGAIPNPASNPTTWWLYTRVINPANASTYKGYRVGINNNSPAGASIYRTIGSTSTQLNSTSGLPAFSLNDKIGIRTYTWPGGVMIECWQMTGGVWRRVCAALDSSGVMPTSGYLGMGISNVSSTPGSEAYDDFGGGTITAPTSSINTDVAPGYTGGVRDQLVASGSKRTAGTLQRALADYTPALVRKAALVKPWGGSVRPPSGQTWPRRRGH
jgi:hypothetical protein